jgi:hypothetical protein
MENFEPAGPDRQAELVHATRASKTYDQASAVTGPLDGKSDSRRSVDYVEHKNSIRTCYTCSLRK